jgi:F-type H+-transporting ATPase subunit c
MKKWFVLFAIIAIFAMPAAAQGTAPAASNWTFSAIGLGIAVAAAAYGQSKVASAVAEGIARNPAARPGIQLALFLGLAFIESLVLFIWLGLLFLAR